MKGILAKTLAAVLIAGAFGSASATTLSGGLTSGVLNTIEDQDREAFVDANSNGILDVGDVFFGFIRIDNFLPKGVNSNNQTYAVLTNQITAVSATDPTVFSLGTTTVVGLRLEDLTGNANAAGGLVAVFDKPAPYATDLINGPPPAATSMFDYINFITSGATLQLVGGISAADDFLTVDNISLFAAGTPTGLIPTVDTSLGVNSFTGGLSVLYNNTGFTFLDAVTTFDPLTGLNKNQIGIANGATRGALGEGNEAIWGNAPGYTQCLVGANGQATNASCGFVTDADFFVVPIPEPGSIALLGASLLGLFGARRVIGKPRA